MFKVQFRVYENGVIKNAHSYEASEHSVNEDVRAYMTSSYVIILRFNRDEKEIVFKSSEQSFRYVAERIN